MPPLRAAFALLLPFTLACSSPPEPAKSGSAKSSSEPAKPANDPVTPATPAKESKRKPFKVEPRAELVAKDVPPAPTLATTTLAPTQSGSVNLPEGIGVVLPHAALALEQGLLIVGQAYVEYDPKIRATEIWQFQSFVPSTGEPRASKGESGSIRAGTLDGEGGALLVGSLGVGMDARAWVGRVGPDGSAKAALPIESLGFSDLLAATGGGPQGELAVLAGFSDTVALLRSIDAAGKKRWQPALEAEGMLQLRALARLDDQVLLGVGSLAQREGNAWWVRAAADGSAIEKGTVESLDLEGSGVDSNRLLYAITAIPDAGLVALGLAKRGVVQDHDQVFAVGFDRSGKVEWARAIDQVRATQVRGALGWQGAAMFVLEVPAGEGRALALLRISGSGDADIRVEQLEGSEGKRSAGFVQGAATPEILIADTLGSLSWQRLAVSP